MSESSPSRALLSVSDKTGLTDFASSLVDSGVQLVSTGGTRRHLAEAGLPVIDIQEVTGFPEIMDGRVKTLHPKVHGGLLGRPDVDGGVMAEHGIAPFTLVCVNLYPFEQTVAKPDVTLAEAIENIDIGGPSMLRSAAKNHKYVLPVTDPADYGRVLTAIQSGEVSDDLRQELALKTFARTASYDRAISTFLARVTGGTADATLDLQLNLRQPLRYGENPHQSAAFYVESDPGPTTLAAAEKLHGKELSYNNLLDLDAALQLIREFDDPACCVLKHTNPCGCAVAADLTAAFVNAYAGDPVSAFGSILGFNRPVDVATAEALCEPGRFIEAIIAPGFDADALEMLQTKPKWKNNVRLLALPTLTDAAAPTKDFRRVTGGLLTQDRDDRPMDESGWTVVTERPPTDEERATLAFAWRVGRHVKSNAIVLSTASPENNVRMIVGVGAGQMSRLDSSEIAARKAGDRAAGSVLASDAFFPFRDGVDQAAAAGVTAVVQPGGSRNDDEVIAACNEHGIAMLFTGQRHFKH